MSIFVPFLTRLVFIAAVLLFMPVVLADIDINCNNTPVEAALHANDTPNIVKFDGDVTSLPFGANLRISVPTSLVNKPNTKIFACIRWQDKDAIEKIRKGIVAKTTDTREKTKIASEKAATLLKDHPNEAVSTVFLAAETAAKEADDAAKDIDTFNKAQDVLNTTKNTAEAANNALQALEKIVPKDETTAALARNAHDAAKAAQIEAEKIKYSFDEHVWTINLPLRVVKSESDITTINVELPDHIKERMDGSNPYTEKCWWPWAKAELRFMATENKKPVLDNVLPLQIGSHGFAATVAVVTIAIFWAIFYSIAKLLNLQGGYFLKVIANKRGYASLSQFQIILWTLVVGGSMLYVMVLSGRLIDIQTTTLYLLGIAGFSMVLGKVQPSSTAEGDNTTSTQKAIPPAATSLPPGAVTDLEVCGNPGETQVVLAWKSPEGGGIPTQYVVQFKKSADTAWSTSPDQVEESPYIVSNLVSDTEYDFQVIAKNNAGDGSSTELKNKKTALSAPAPAPAMVEGVTPDEKQSKEDQILLKWNSLKDIPDRYVVRYRLAGKSPWNIAGVVATTDSTYRIRKLLPNTDYEFQVFGVKNGRIGAASLAAPGRTAPRTRRWSDLLEAEGGGEVDVARIQMLFFTLIAAIFVLLKVVSSNEIPVIPDGILLLMGISNGVYLTAKFIPARQSEMS